MPDRTGAAMLGRRSLAGAGAGRRRTTPAARCGSSSATRPAAARTSSRGCWRTGCAIAWGQPVTVENRGGAAGHARRRHRRQGARRMATRCWSAPPPRWRSPASTMRNITLRAAKDFAPVALLTEQPFLVLVNAALPAASLAELVALAQARPGTVRTYEPRHGHRHGGRRPPADRAAAAETGIAITHIPYRGGGPAMTDLVAGQVQIAAGRHPLRAAASPLRAGIRALALCRDHAFGHAAAEVPTTAEAGFPFLIGSTWSTLVAPARTPEPILARLSARPCRRPSAARA